MSIFRPAARVSTPDGQTWELYAYRLTLRKRGRYDPGLDGEDSAPAWSGAYAEAELATSMLDAVIWVLALVPRLLVRLLWDLPRAAVAAAGSDEWTIEAVSWQPHRTSMTWRTTGAARGEVLRDLQGQLARGEQPRPRNATFLGVDGFAAP